ncbi:MAG: hypothetical protein GDA48_15980 [Hormoscilla sp. GM102CHS1]|nr:hypothetical protein [Hormoscilla sp. GM102CHS1]
MIANFPVAVPRLFIPDRVGPVARCAQRNRVRMKARSHFPYCLFDIFIVTETSRGAVPLQSVFYLLPIATGYGDMILRAL